MKIDSVLGLSIALMCLLWVVHSHDGELKNINAKLKTIEERTL